MFLTETTDPNDADDPPARKSERPVVAPCEAHAERHPLCNTCHAWHNRDAKPAEPEQGGKLPSELYREMYAARTGRQPHEVEADIRDNGDALMLELLDRLLGKGKP